MNHLSGRFVVVHKGSRVAELTNGPQSLEGRVAVAVVNLLLDDAKVLDGLVVPHVRNSPETCREWSS